MFRPGQILLVSQFDNHLSSLRENNIPAQNCGNPPCQGTRSLETYNDYSVCNRCGRQVEHTEFVESYNDMEWEEHQNEKIHHEQTTKSHHEILYIENKIKHDKFNLTQRSCDKLNEPKESLKATRLNRARDIIKHNFSNRYQLSESSLLGILQLYEQLLKFHDKQIKNVLSALCACMVVYSEQNPEQIPLKPQTIGEWLGIHNIGFELEKSVRNFVKLIRSTLDIKPPSREQMIRHWTYIFERNINDGKLCDIYHRRIMQQLELTLNDVKTSTQLQARTPITIAATIIFLALDQLHVEHLNGKIHRVTIQFVHHLTGVTHNGIKETQNYCRRIPKVLKF